MSPGPESWSPKAPKQRRWDVFPNSRAKRSIGARCVGHAKPVLVDGS